jgi:hypothetical protein
MVVFSLKKHSFGAFVDVRQAGASQVSLGLLGCRSLRFQRNSPLLSMVSTLRLRRNPNAGTVTAK